MNDLFLPASNKIFATTIKVPGSKSIANRVLLLASLAHGTTILSNIPDDGEDVSLMLNAIQSLGIKIKHKSQGNYEIKGNNGKFINTNQTIFCGNSGTSLRFLLSALALDSGNYVLTGTARMKERPIKDLVDALNSIGAQIVYLEQIGYPPLAIKAFNDNGNSEIVISAKNSSQYLSSLLIALTGLKRKIKIIVIDQLISQPYVSMTQELLKLFTVNWICNPDGRSYQLLPSNNLKGIIYKIEPDASSANYFLALAALKGKIIINDLNSNSIQGDKNFSQILAQMGAIVKYGINDIMVNRSALNGITIDMTDMPDSAMIIAILALFAKNRTRINGIKSWRIKECNRITALASLLKKLGAKVKYGNSWLQILPPHTLNNNITINTYNDHRIAMCFSLIAAAGYAITIENYRCVNKTFTNYFKLFSQICYNSLDCEI